MDTYLDIAKEYISTAIGTDFAIVPESIHDLEDVFSFSYQTRTFLETGNFSYMTVGQGPTFIHKKDDRIFHYGSRFSFEEALNDLRKKLETETRIKTHTADFDLDTRYNLQINRIKKKQLLIDTLVAHKIEYIIPEIVGDSIFRISKTYKFRGLEIRLKELPAIFNATIGNTNVDLINDLIQQDSCEFELIKHIPMKYEVYTSRATPEDLKPIW
jgi:hypothetical protein